MFIYIKIKDHGFLNKLLFSLTLLVVITAVNAQVQPVKKNKQTLLHWMIPHLSIWRSSNDFVYDMKYATEDNFLKAKVYCAECYFAPENSCP
jgi:D-alanyl-D-alanine dipeptidase